MAENKKKVSSESPPPTSFSSLPYDVALNCLARISRNYYPTLSLVSKSFRSLVASPDLEARRSLIGITEDCFYVCFYYPCSYNSNPKWFTFRPIPKPSLVLAPSFPYQYPKYPTVVPVGSEIYIIGGVINYERSSEVFLLDCRTHQWRQVPPMKVARANPAAGVFDGKIFVVGGCEFDNVENRGEIYEPKTKTWKPLVTTPDLSIRNCLVPFNVDTKFLLLVKENILCRTSIFGGGVMWCDLSENLVWREVKGLRFSLKFSFISLANDGGGKLSVSWCKISTQPHGVHRIEIWCTKFSVERRYVAELWGIVESSNLLFSIEGIGIFFDNFVCTATVTH